VDQMEGGNKLSCSTNRTNDMTINLPKVTWDQQCP